MKKKQFVYIADKSDKIDVGLAKYINTHPMKDQMKDKFKRISEGYYHFGAKLVNLKLDKNGYLVIKSGIKE